jgi:hypothetical protein
MSSNNDDCSSICSEASNVSVSYKGDDDMPLNDAVDMIFKDIQTHINDIHVNLRQLVMADDRNEDYDECLEYHEALTEHVRDACMVFKDVIKVSRQLLPKKPKNYVDLRKAQGSVQLPDVQE